MVWRKLWIASLLALAAGMSAAVATATDPPSMNGGGIPSGFDLKKQLQTGLKARRPVEFQYLDRVVTLVDTGILPRSMVDSTFMWARKKSTKQLQYFQFALRARAAKQGIFISDLNDQAVGIGGSGLIPSQ